jgi:hypothetical protein
MQSQCNCEAIERRKLHSLRTFKASKYWVQRHQSEIKNSERIITLNNHVHFKIVYLLVAESGDLLSFAEAITVGQHDAGQRDGAVAHRTHTLEVRWG